MFVNLTEAVNIFASLVHCFKLCTHLILQAVYYRCAQPLVCQAQPESLDSPKISCVN